jgi:hypothetical protein
MKMRKKVSNLRIPCFLAISLLLLLGTGLGVAHAETYQYTIEAGKYEIVDAGDGYQEIKMEGFGQLLEPGKPKLPSKIFSVAIPPDVKVDSVEVAGTGLAELPGTYNVVPAPMVSPLSATEEELKKARAEYDETVKAAYASDQPYPAETGMFITQGAYRRYNLAQVRYSPFYYRAKSGRLYFYPTVQVTVTYSYSATISAEAEMMTEDYVPEAEERAEEIIINYEDAQNWYPAPVDDPIATTGGFVIVTTQALEDSVWPIKNWETCKGRAVYVETVESINANYSGVDLAQKIRNFLRARLTTWNILKVLLVGDISDVPMRYTYPSGPDGPDDDTTPWELEDRVPTDYYYAELSWADSTSWNSNGDSMYGQQGVDNVQFPNEVDVGRIPWSDPGTVEDICMKMVEFEYSTDMDYKLNYLLTGAFFWSDTDNAVVKTYILNHELDPGDPPIRIYEQDPNCWDSLYYSEYAMSRTITREVWGVGHYGFVNLAGHGSSSGVAFKQRHPTCNGEYYFYGPQDCSYLNDNYPSIVFSCACSTAYPEATNLGKRLLERGAVSFVGSTRTAFGSGGWDDPSDGSSQTLDWLFSHFAVSYTYPRSSVGWSHQRALEHMYDYYNWNNSWWEFFEWNIYSNPDLWLRDRPTALPNLDYLYRTGWDYPIVPRSASGATSTWCPVTSTLPGNTANTYFNWTVENNGASDAPPCKTSYYVDDRFIGYRPAAIAADSSDYIINWNYGPTVQGGRHSLYYYIDSDDEVWETNEGDNLWAKQFVWSPYYLSDDTPVSRSAPPIKDAWPFPYWWFLYNNDGFYFVVNQVHPNKWWSAVGILPYNASADYDVRLWDIGDYTGSEQGFGSGYLEWSSYGGSASDFVIVNDNTAPAGTYYAGAINYNNESGNFHIEEATSTKIQAGINGPYNMSSTAVLDIYETVENLASNSPLSAGTWGFKLEQTSGTCDLGMSLYDDETVHCAKSEYMTGGYANSGGDGEDEYMEVSIPDDGYHGLVVWKADSSDYSKSSTYNIKMGKCTTPSAPANPDPPDGATDVSRYTDLDWSDCTDIDHYDVWFNDGSGWTKLGETNTSDWDLPTLEYSHHYDWIIQAVNICGYYAWGAYWDFTTGAEPKPDLIVSSITTNPYYPEPGETVDVEVTIKNQGDLDARSAFYTSFYKHRTSPPPVGEAGDLNWTLSKLAAGASYTFSGTVSYDIGCYQMYAQVDTKNDVDEGNEGNNVYGPKNILVGACEGDFDNDGDVDGSDLAIFAADFGRTDCSVSSPCEGDFDNDGDVDGSDLAVFAADFGRTDCQPCP